MKILVVASSMVHIKNFHLPYIEEFSKRGNSVDIMASGEGANINIPFKKRAFSFKNFALSFKIRKHLKKNNYDIIYLHTTLASFWTRFALWGMKKRPIVVNTVHGYLFSPHSSKLKRAVYLLAEKLMRKRTDYIVVMNKEDYDIATENKLCKKEVVFIDGMGVLPSRLPEYSCRECSTDVKNLIFVGEISKRKNQIFLVKSLNSLENVHLTLVGDGDERKNIEKYAKKYNLQNRLTITGFSKEVNKYLSNADIYVSASTIEGLPFNIIEAMNARLPIVASDIKGHRELLPSDSLYPLNDMNAFVSRINEIIIEEKLYDIEKYRFENAFSKNIDIYLSFAK